MACNCGKKKKTAPATGWGVTPPSDMPKPSAPIYGEQKS